MCEQQNERPTALVKKNFSSLLLPLFFPSLILFLLFSLLFSRFRNPVFLSLSKKYFSSFLPFPLSPLPLKNIFFLPFPCKKCCRCFYFFKFFHGFRSFPINFN
ncbi:unnamed protein product [Meloidogyne enterolobii]|uniref:Uncharacterized protein n=1 Tax=Meloidogyne enterolobii TaxID=390850 RepID=A0ACB1A0J3_MELEN